MSSRERKRSEGAEPEIAAAEPASQPVDAPTELPAEKPESPRKEPKVKATYSLPVSLARLINTVADELGIDACELVATKMTAALKGCRRPTIPEELRRAFPAKSKSAA